MIRRTVLALVLLLPGLAQAGPKEDAEAVFARFLAAFTAADPARVVDQFWPDALFWGTGMSTLATEEEPVRAYFSPMARSAPGQRRASAVSTSTAVLSDSAVLISGVWQVETGSEGSIQRLPLRVSMVVTRRDGAWRVAQFHNSRMPTP